MILNIHTTQITAGPVPTKMENIPVIVGSAAYNVSGRIVRDIDMIGTFESITETFKKIAMVHGKESQYAESDSLLILKTSSGLIVEGSIAWEGTSNADILDWIPRYMFTRTVPPKPVQVDFEHYVAPDTICWLLKESHKYKDSVHFEKTRADVLAFRSLRKLNVPVSFYFSEKGLSEILAKREEETYRPAVKLNVEKDKFFANDGIDYSICAHDTIHELIALGSRPAYTRIQHYGSDVMCDKNLWHNSTLETKFHCVIEEARVIAIERGILPYGKTFVDDEVAIKLFKTALQKICTTLCSGWFREFAWINYDLIIKQHLEYEAVNTTNFINIFHIDWKSK